VSVTDYGILTSFVSFVLFVALFSDMGLRTTATKYVGSAFFSKDRKLWRYITQLAVARFALIISIGLVLAWQSAFFAELVMHSPEYAFVFQFTGIAAVFYAAMHFFEGLVSSANMYEYTFAGSVIVNAARLLLPVALVLFLAPTAKFAIMGLSLAYLAGALAYAVFFRRIYGFRPERSREIEKGFRNYALYAALIELSAAFLSNFDAVLLNAFLSPASVGLYKAAQMVLIGVLSLTPISYLVVFTFFVELEASGNRREQHISYTHAVKYGLAFFIPVSAMMLALAPEMMGFFYPPEYASAAVALRTFAFLPAFYFLFNVNINAMFARGEIRAAAWLCMLAAGASLVMNLLLIPLLGFVGSAVAYTGAYMLATLLSLSVLSGRLSLSVGPHVLARPLLVSAAASILTEGARAFVTSSGIALLVIFPVACALAYAFMLDEEDRALFAAVSELFHKA